MREDELAAAAEAILPHLPVLVGEDAPLVRERVEALLARRTAGEPVRAELAETLTERDETREWLRLLFDVPSAARAFAPLPGTEQVGLPRYACPEGDQEPWFRFDVRDAVPVCSVHRVPYERVA